MKRPAIISLFAWGLLLAVAGTAQAAGDPAAGKQKNTMCIGCHGIEGYRTSYPTVYNVPRIGGQHAEYLVKALQAYKTDARSHPSMKAYCRPTIGAGYGRPGGLLRWCQRKIITHYARKAS